VSKPLVSVVMPVYNAGRYLYQAVQSVFAQTLDDWELIMVDDASTDESWTLMESVNDTRVKIARNTVNMKQSFTQNRGVDMAEGKYIARMDADDISLPGRLEKQVYALECDTRVDVLGCGTIRVSQDAKTIFEVRRPPTSHSEICRWGWLQFPITHGAMVGKTSWFRRWKADPRVRVAQDFELLYRSHTDSVFGNIKDLLYVYRDAGFTRTLRQKNAGVYYKAYGLCKNGLRFGLIGKTLLGLLSLAPRPPLYALNAFRGHKGGIVRVQGVGNVDPDENLVIRDALARVLATDVPIRKKMHRTNEC